MLLLSVEALKLDKNQKNLFDTSLVMLEAGIPVPSTKPIKKQSLVSVSNESIVDQKTLEKLEVDKKKKKGAPTTLTIVQDFPKKKNNGESKMQLVQGK